MSVTEAPYPKTDKEWQAHDDAQTLARAEVIKNDKSRLASAQTAAAQIAKREREEANAMQKVAGPKRKADSSAAVNRQPSKKVSSRRVGGGLVPKDKGGIVKSSNYNVFKKI